MNNSSLQQLENSEVYGFYWEIVLIREKLESYQKRIENPDLSSDLFIKINKELSEYTKTLYERNVFYSRPSKKNPYQKLLKDSEEIKHRWSKLKIALSCLLEISAGGEAIERTEVKEKLIVIIKIIDAIQEALQAPIKGFLQNIRKLLGEGEIQAAINQLAEDLSILSPELRDKITLYKSRYAKLQKDERQGIITPQDYRVEITRLTQSILDFLRQSVNKIQYKKTPALIKKIETNLDIEIWFAALKLAETFSDEGIQIKLLAQTSIDPKTNQTEIDSIDKISIRKHSATDEVYYLKFRAPNITSWQLTNLKVHPVLSEFRQQFRENPDSVIYFASQHPCPIFQDILPLGALCSSRDELKTRLASDNLINDWDALQEELRFSDEEMFRFSRQARYKPVADIENLRNDIIRKFKNEVTNEAFVPDCLYQLAIEAGKRGEAIAKKDIIAYFEKNDIHCKSHIPSETLLYSLSKASASLRSVSNTFFDDHHINFEDRHLKRDEVDSLLNWVTQPLPAKTPPIAILTGRAGSGKSVILRDLLEKLQKKEIPVLGIKTDWYMYDSIHSLSQELDITDGITETLASVVEKHGRAVVLLDQIDALSQSASGNQQVFNTYRNIISQLSLINNLRIIISCRAFDLKFDPLLQSFKDKYTIEVQDLQKDDIVSILSKQGIQQEQISKTLFDLLKLPLHLKVFIDIYPKMNDPSSLATLQDLYDELWNQSILPAPERQSVVDAINRITEEMHSKKLLSVPFALRDKEDVGIQYLLHQSFLIPQRKQLQFFHQTFFDYCYARAFVNQHGSLINVVLQDHQGLFIRSQVKQVLSYLRGSDLRRYLTELQAFLTHKDLRFHLWLLVVNQLASVEEPTDEEWFIVKPLLDTQPDDTQRDFRPHFLEAFQSGWLSYLLDSGILRSFLESPDVRLFNLTIWKLGALINRCPDIVVDFLVDFPDIEKKAEYICGILLRLDTWEYAKAVSLFEQYLPTFKTFSEQYPYYQVMNSVFPYQPELVCKIFFADLQQKVNAIQSADEFDKRAVFSHEDIDLFEKILKKENTKDTALVEGLCLVRKLIKNTKGTGKSAFYGDRAFSGMEQFSPALYRHWMFFALLRKQLLVAAQHDKPRFLELMAGIEESYSFTLLILLMQGYLRNPEHYVKEGFALLTRPGILDRLTTELSGGRVVRKLLGKIYPYLSSEHRETINNMILSVNPDWESGKSRGYSKYLLLCAIPQEELEAYPAIKKQRNELKRKFGPHEEKPSVVSKVVEVGPPLPEEAYEKMTFEQWIASFKKYDDSTGWGQPREDFLKGGIIEHSRKFTECVSKRADYFYDFVFSLGKREDISKVYLEAGIRGLVEAKYDTHKVAELVKTYWEYEEAGFRKQIISAIEYIDKEDTLDLELVKIIEDYVLHDPDPIEESWMIDAGSGTPYYGGNPVDSGINTVRGAAAWGLAIHGYKTPYPDKVFGIMDRVANDPSISVRCCLITNLQGMLNWDRDRTYRLFMKLTHDNHPKVIKEGLRCLSYLMTEEKFPSFVTHLKIALRIDEHYGRHHVGEYVGQILMLAYVREYSNSKELLEEGFHVSDHIKAGAIDFASKHLLEADKKVADKAKEVYSEFLDEDSEDIYRMYDSSFHAFKPEDFRKLYGLLEAYTRSKAASYDALYFFEYLKQCVISEPERCIDLIQNYINFEQSESQRRSSLREKTLVQILIGAYSKPISDKYKEKVMNIFDKILQNQAYKHEGLKVLEEQDRG